MNKSAGTWKGVPIEELTREELMQAFLAMAAMHEEAVRRAEDYMKLP